MTLVVRSVFHCAFEGCRLRDDASRQCRTTVKKNARERGERRYDQSRSDPGVVCCLIACARRVYWPGSRRQEQSVTQRFGNPTIGKQRKSFLMTFL